MTWFTHMRAPRKLYRDLGFSGFLGVQVLLLGGFSAFLAAPVFWALWLAHFSVEIIPMDVIPTGFWWTFLTVMAAGQLVMLRAVYLAISHNHLRHLMPYVLTLPIYWPLGMLASYKAISELFFAPFYWDKTRHGHDQES